MKRTPGCSSVGVMESVEDYARFKARLDRGETPREAVLAAAGLDEEEWEALDERWQLTLSEAMAADEPGEALTRFSIAYAAAQGELATPITLEQLAQATRLIGVHGDLGVVLDGLGLKLADYLHGQQHWMKRMTLDPGMAARFEGLVAGADPGEDAPGPEGGQR